MKFTSIPDRYSDRADDPFHIGILPKITHKTTRPVEQRVQA
jgi:hypothetical protein